ncbi:MAG TPA: hypothetical protein VMX16_11560 [Terriglobia bacterium]|nr:hypothetical protein [Terriglobia bacterium]
MKILVSALDRFLQALNQKRLELKAAAGRLGLRAVRWLNRARRMERISSRDLRVVGATLRTLPPPAARREPLEKRSVRVTSKALDQLRVDGKPLGIRSMEKKTLELESAVSADFERRKG